MRQTLRRVWRRCAFWRKPEPPRPLTLVTPVEDFLWPGKPWKIRVTGHAVMRAREGVPAWRFKSNRSIRDRIATDVQEALSEHRVAKREPRSWPERRYARGGSKKKQPVRYAWVEDESRLYVICRNAKSVSVMTTVTKNRARRAA